MPPTIRSLRRAFRLFDEQPKELEFTPMKVDRRGPLDEARLHDAQARLGWELPEEYRLLLAAVGPYRVSDVDGEEWTEFLEPSVTNDEGAALHAHLETLRTRYPEGHALAAVVRAPREALLVAATWRDSNHDTQWTFYVKGSESLYEVHKKDPLEELDSLEEGLIGLICGFAGYDARTSTWSPR